MSGLQAETISLTRDGRQMAIGTLNIQSNLMLVERTENGSIQNKPLTQGTAIHNAPSISPDGTQIAFVRGDTSTSNIFTMPIEGGAPKQLTFFNSVSGGPVWSPDGARIAFGSLEGGLPALWLLPASGGQSLKLGGAKLFDFDLAWAPSSKIALHTPGNQNFILFDPNSEDKTYLLEDESLGWPFFARFSPDARQVLMYWNRLVEGPTLWIISPKDPVHGAARPITGRKRINLNQTIDASPYLNRDVQLRVTMKADGRAGDGGGCFGALIRGHRVRRALSNRSEEPAIRTSRWTDCVVEGRVGPDAEKIIFGAFLEGTGAVWMDAFKLAFRGDNNQWQSIPITNHSFEEGQGDALVGWSVEPVGYPVTPVSDAYDGKRSVVIENRSKVTMSDGLFVPIGWSPDATQAYALDTGRRTVVAIPIAGGPAKPVFELPWSKDLTTSWTVAMTPDARRFVFSVGQSQEDIWIIDNFDPDVR
jgi:hypothetical protein